MRSTLGLLGIFFGRLSVKQRIVVVVLLGALVVGVGFLARTAKEKSAKVALHAKEAQPIK